MFVFVRFRVCGGRGFRRVISTSERVPAMRAKLAGGISQAGVWLFQGAAGGWAAAATDSLLGSAVSAPARRDSDFQALRGTSGLNTGFGIFGLRGTPSGAATRPPLPVHRPGSLRRHFRTGAQWRRQQRGHLEPVVELRRSGLSRCVQGAWAIPLEASPPQRPSAAKDGKGFSRCLQGWPHVAVSSKKGYSCSSTFLASSSELPAGIDWRAARHKG